MPAAIAQSNDQTEQTDKSEEDWRKSQRKSDHEDPFGPFSQKRNSGFGGVLPPMRPIDKLPEASRRHLQKERAKAIAGMGADGEIQDTKYEPSDRAKTDPALAQEEAAVWEEMIEGLQGSGNSKDDGTRPGDGSENEAGNIDAAQQIASGGSSGRPAGSSPQRPGDSGAVDTGAEASQTRSVMRGGSSASASDILKQMRGVQARQGSQTSGSPTENPRSDSNRSVSRASSIAGKQAQTEEQTEVDGTSENRGVLTNSEDRSREIAHNQPTDASRSAEAVVEAAQGQREETNENSSDDQGGTPSALEVANSESQAENESPYETKTRPIGAEPHIGVAGSSSSASDYLRSRNPSGTVPSDD